MLYDNSKTKAHWDSKSDEYYNISGREQVIKKVIENPYCAFPKRTFEMIKKCFPNLEGKKIYVPSSGDNLAVFAFQLMGAQVTSTDISSQQIKNAQSIAKHYGWDIEFLCEDSMDLNNVKSDEYDLVYTSNGVHVWISDLKVMYKNFNRVLKDNGYYIMFETHPFIRPFDDSQHIITIRKLYEDIGPFGDIPNYLWRIEDFINSLIAAKFSIKELAEFHPMVDDLAESHCWWYHTEEEAIKDNYIKFDWDQNPWAALPQWLGICANKSK